MIISLPKLGDRGVAILENANLISRACIAVGFSKLLSSRIMFHCSQLLGCLVVGRCSFVLSGSLCWSLGLQAWCFSQASKKLVAAWQQ